MASHEVIAAATAQLRTLPGVDVRLPASSDARDRVNVRIRDRSYEYVAVVAARPLSTSSSVAHVLATSAGTGAHRLVCAPRIEPEAAAVLREHGLDYVDGIGNAHLSPAPPVYIHVERDQRTRRRPAADGRQRLRGGGLHVVFALLARPDAAATTVRELAVMAGTTKSTVSSVLARLEREGFIGRARGTRVVVRRDQLLSRWVESYAHSLRPRWVQGRYRLRDRASGPLEQMVADALPGATWAWGGTVAEMKLVDYYAGPHTVIHLLTPEPELPRRLRVLPADDGDLTIMLTPIPLAFESPIANVAHPVLVYSELATSADPRARDAARELRDRLFEAPA